MSDVFISYSSKDEDFAIMLYKTLKTKNVKPWIALFDIPYGQNYAKEIFNAIENVKIFSVIISSNSNESDPVKNEIELATQQIKNGMMIMPIRIDKKEIDEELQYYLARKQWLDASIPPIQEKINSYCEHIRNMLNTNTINEHEVSSESRHLKDNIQSDNFIKKEIHDTYKKYARILIEHRAFTYAARDIASDILFGVMETTELKIVNNLSIDEQDIIEVDPVKED